MLETLPASIPLHQRGNANKGSLLFLHANSYSAGMYNDFLEPLEAEYQITSPDLPGHGQSSWQGRIDSWEKLADYYIQQLDLSAERAPRIGMGHSIGGILILFIALKRPDIFSKIILLDPVLLPKRILYVFRFMKLLSLSHTAPIARAALRRRRSFSSPEMALKAYSKKRVFSNWKEGYLEAYIKTCMRTNDDGSVRLACRPELESSIYQSVPVNAWSLPGKTSVPALYIIGSRSDTVNARGVNRLKRKVGADKVKTISGGHLFPFEDPEGTMAIIKEFLADEN